MVTRDAPSPTQPAPSGWGDPTQVAANAAHITQAGITTAVAWGFTQMLLPGSVHPTDHPHLTKHAEAAERLAAFAEYPAKG